VANGEAARMVLYRYDFEDGSPMLNARGLDELARIAALLPQNFYPLVVERTPCDPGLAEARKGLQGLDGLAAKVDRGYLRAEPAGAVVQASARSPYLPTDPVLPEASSALTRVSLKVPVALEATELAELKACSATGSQAPASAWPDLAEDRKGLVKMTKAPEDECDSPRMGEADSCHSPPGAVGGEWVW
jgi:hypothetical protein